MQINLLWIMAISSQSQENTCKLEGDYYQPITAEGVFISPLSIYNDKTFKLQYEKVEKQPKILYQFKPILGTYTLDKSNQEFKLLLSHKNWTLTGNYTNCNVLNLQNLNLVLYKD